MVHYGLAVDSDVAAPDRVGAVRVSRVVIVHGVGQQFSGRWSMQGALAAALLDGLEHAGVHGVLRLEDVGVAFYGNAFRATGTRGGLESRRPSEIVDSFEIALLKAWWVSAAASEPDRVPPVEAPGRRVPTPVTAQRALNALLRSRFISSAIAERFLVGTLGQVRRYLTEDGIRERVQADVAARVSKDTLVLVGHSLGSIVAYETLCANPSWPVRALITLGSPLGIPGLIFERLRPSPSGNRGAWPAGVSTWINLCDRNDVVASVKNLGPLFDHEPSRVQDCIVNNGWKAHDLARHLTAEQTGRAIATGLGVGL